MRWYCVPCRSASRLKKSTLCFDNAIVTLTGSSRKTSWSGGGRKSGRTLILPSGSSVYLILLLIDPSAPPQIARSDDPNDIVAIREPHRDDRAADDAEAVVAPFPAAVCDIFCDHATRVSERELRLGEHH